MKQMKFFALAAIVVAMLTGCTSYGRYVNNNQTLNLNQTQVTISTNNFRVVRTVQATVIYTQKDNLFRGRFDYSQLKQSAYAALLKEANLTGSQLLINVTIEEVQRVAVSGLFFPRRKADHAIQATGVVIEFCDPSMVNIPQNVVYDEQQPVRVAEQQISQSVIEQPAIEEVQTPEQYWNNAQNYPNASVYKNIVYYCDKDKNGKLSEKEIASLKIKLSMKDKDDKSVMSKIQKEFAGGRINNIYSQLRK